MQKTRAVVFHERTTANYHIYQSADAEVIAYVRRKRLTDSPPDALVAELRTPTEGDMGDVGD